MSDLKKFIRLYSVNNNEHIYKRLKTFPIVAGTWTDNDANFVAYQNMSVVETTDMEIVDSVNRWATECSLKYATEFNFKITKGSFPRFNSYSVGQYMENHIDHIHSCFDGNYKGIPIFSLVGAFNDDYEGGNFVFKLCGEEVSYKLKAGTVLAFPSAFPWEHRVDPVINGTRYTWVSWFW